MASLFLLLREGTTECWSQAKRGKQIRRNARTPHHPRSFTFRLAEQARDRVTGSERLKRVVLPLPVKKVRVGGTEIVGCREIRWRDSGRKLKPVDRNQPLGVRKWQWSQKNAIDQAEDRCRGANTKCKRKHDGYRESWATSDVWNPYQPEFFLPYAQDPTPQRPLVVLKVAGDPSSYENAVRRIVASIDKDVPVFRYRTFTYDIEMQAAQPRFEAVLVSGFAGIALLLWAVALYAVLSYIVAERTRELGLRMALGASRSNVLRLVLRRGLTLACSGIAIGALTSIFATRLITDALFRVAPLDRSVFLTVTVVLIFVSMTAALTPALRAAHVDPMRTLREQ